MALHSHTQTTSGLLNGFTFKNSHGDRNSLVTFSWDDETETFRNVTYYKLFEFEEFFFFKPEWGWVVNRQSVVQDWIRTMLRIP